MNGTPTRTNPSKTPHPPLATPKTVGEALSEEKRELEHLEREHARLEVANRTAQEHFNEIKQRGATTDEELVEARTRVRAARGALQDNEREQREARDRIAEILASPESAEATKAAKRAAKELDAARATLHASQRALARAFREAMKDYDEKLTHFQKRHKAALDAAHAATGDTRGITDADGWEDIPGVNGGVIEAGAMSVPLPMRQPTGWYE